MVIMRQTLIELAAALVLCWPITAAEIVVVQPVSASCASSDTSQNWDEFLEGWTGAGEEEATWTGTISGHGATMNNDYDTTALSSGKPAGACNEAQQWVVSNSDGTEEGQYIDVNGGTINYSTTATEINFYIYVDTMPALNTGFRIFGFGASTTIGTVSQSVLLQNDGGTCKLRLLAGGNTTYIACSEDTWHLVRILSDGAGNWTFYVDASSASTTISGTGFRYLQVGPILNLDATEGATYYIDLIGVYTP